LPPVLLVVVAAMLGAALPQRRAEIDPVAIRHFEQLQVRRTDRRTVSDTLVAPAVLDALVAVTEQAGARLHLQR
jgi:hypothetical protein